ncbi:MAG: hypothetical protein NVS9B15_24910 [Acidobacteriaceae bacterium]
MTSNAEPWLRGTHPDVDPVQRHVLHALELTREDCARWCDGLTDVEINARPQGLEPVAFHLRHIARSLDRLLCYAERVQLNAGQFAALKSEFEPGATTGAVIGELSASLDHAARRIQAFSPSQYNEARTVGRSRLPSTVAGLLIHCAEHTQRHTGQAITTAKLLLRLRDG